MYNITMSKNGGRDVASGFTIIEVMLVLAVTGFLFIGILGGMSGSLARQRYKDAVQDTADSLRRMYSYVVDTQVYTRENDSVCYGLTSDAIGNSSLISNSKNTGRGRSDCVVYGLVATIANSHIEFTELVGKEYEVVREEVADKDKKDTDTMKDIEVLQLAGANNVVASAKQNGTCSNIGLVNLLESSDSRWGTRILDTDGNELATTILIFRSPQSGVIRTYVMDGTPKNGDNIIRYDEFSEETHDCTEKNILDTYGINEYIGKYETEGDEKVFKSNFTEKELKICISSGDTGVYDGRMRMIKIAKGGRSSSAIALIDMDDEDANECN